MIKELKNHYIPDPKLAKLLKGKRVAYVCPGAHVQGTGTGELIDSYDIVCRVDIVRHMPKNTWEDYGKRTDILTTGGALRFMKLVEQQLDGGTEFFNQLKYVIIPRHNQEWGQNHYPGYGTDEYMDSLLEYKIPIHCFTKEYLNYITRKFFGGKNPYTGMCGILMLLNYEISELYVTGMNFCGHFEKRSSALFTNDEMYFKGHIEYSTMPDGSPLQIGHEAEPQVKFLRTLKNEYSILTFDNYLKTRL